ncbi:hypothetical protein J2X31_002461 [Flavobacterium arsenatis]|uniref:Uncharacterized protein n=1 Tax=Flavobacterium arsenatis TaxID=1484332 RepID=A0ABU1TRD8_9FLAO|nr:hypothetical protein [Flavobacterium arsenatis]
MWGLKSVFSEVKEKKRIVRKNRFILEYFSNSITDLLFQPFFKSLHL